MNDAIACPNSGACTTPADLDALADRVREDVDTILSRLRDEGGYAGRIVVVDYCAVD